MVFREIYPNGNETVFTITEKKPFTRYAFHMENKRLVVNGLVLWRSLRMEDAV